MRCIRRGAITGSSIILATLGLFPASSGMARASTYEILYSFEGGPDGASPNGVTLGKNGQLYGTTYTGGANLCDSAGYYCGSAFELIPASTAPWTKAIIYSFNGADGALPSPGELAPGPALALGKNGTLFGTTANGGSSDPYASSLGGTAFELIPPTASGEVWT